MTRSVLWTSILAVLFACCLLIPSQARAGSRSDENKAACKAWCADNADEGCHHCHATSVCGGGYSSMRKFGDVIGTWYACRLNSFGQRGERNHEECNAYCRSNPECVGCTSTACGKDVKLLKMFTGGGKDWYACQKTDWAEHSDQARAAAVGWCEDYTKGTGEECRIVKSGQLCPDGFYKSDRQTVTWGRDYNACLQRKSHAQRVKDCSGAATANIEKALDWINTHYEAVTDFRMQPNAYRDRRAHARLDRKWPHVTVQCEDDTSKCRNNATLGGWSATARYVNLCYDNMDSFCGLVGIIVHESGHNAWVKQDVSQHVGDPGPMNDTVYNFGYRAFDLCMGKKIRGTSDVPAGSPSYDYALR